MSTLKHIAQQQPEMGLDRFVEVANELLPQFLPDQDSSGRGQEPVNPRLVRHYTTQGLLDKPLKQGREARYLYRHLLQLLVLRRLLAESYSMGSISDLVSGQSDEVLAGLLKGGIQLTVEAANPALAFLSQVRDRGQSVRRSHAASPGDARNQAPPSPLPPASARSSIESAQSNAASCPQTWTRLPVLDGLELHVREDFVPPSTAHERQHLRQLIEDWLSRLPSSRRTPK